MRDEAEKRLNHQRISKFVCLLLMVMLTGVVDAQESTPTPESIDPSLIFAEGIRYELISPIVRTPQPTDEPITPERICDNFDKAEAGKGIWTYFTDPETRKTSLCRTDTGEQHGELPTEIIWGYWINDDGSLTLSLPSLSPDGRYLVLAGYKEIESFTTEYQVYSYDLNLDQIRYMGMFQRSDATSVEFGEWVSDTQGSLMVSDERRAYLGGEIYGFDVTKPDSFEPVIPYFDSVSTTLHFDPKARRYESVLSYFQTANEYGSIGTYPCVLYMYDANGAAEYELGNHCMLLSVDLDYYTNALRAGNRYFYLNAESNKATISDLRIFDLDTREIIHTQIWGEIEMIGSVSPDGRYVWLLFGDDGELHHLTSYFNILNEDTWLGLYDTQRIDPTGAENPLLYFVQAGYQDSLWLDNQTSLIELGGGMKDIRAAEDGGIYSITLYGLQKVQVQDVGVVRTEFINIDPATLLAWGISPDKRYILDEHYQRVINLETLDLMPLFREDAPTFDYQLAWDDRGLVVEIPTLEVKYRVMLP